MNIKTYYGNIQQATTVCSSEFHSFIQQLIDTTKKVKRVIQESITYIAQTKETFLASYKNLSNRISNISAEEILILLINFIKYGFFSLPLNVFSKIKKINPLDEEITQQAIHLLGVIAIITTITTHLFFVAHFSTTLCFITLSSICLTIYLSNRYINSTKKKLETLEEQIKKLKDLDACCEEYKTLNTSLKKRINNIQEEVTRFTQENNTFKSSNQTLKEQIEQIKLITKTYPALQSFISHFEGLCEKLSEKLDHLNKSIKE